MADDNPYKIAYERERAARHKAESLLNEKTRSLYDNVVELQNTVSVLEETQDKLVQSEKMASIGQLAAGVAHEINNPIGFSLSNLSVLTGYLESILKLDQLVVTHLDTLSDTAFSSQYQSLRQQEDIDFLTADSSELLADSIKGLHRVSSIVANLNKVSHSGPIEKEMANINQVIEDSIKVVWSELKYNMEVKKIFADLPPVPCHIGEIHQVLMNLFLNASHACEDKGILTIKTGIREVEGKKWIVIQISDNGKGMPKEVMKKIFDPFYTTKPVGSGTGLGLSVSFGIIDKHQGTIDVKSREGVGTLFTVSLPAQ